MTDEELVKRADEYINAQGFTDIYSVSRKAELACFWARGYRAGATENGVVWHDLRKNPDDLPTDRYFKITSDGDIALYDWFWGKWYDLRSCELTYQPASWCEIPKFEEEKNG